MKNIVILFGAGASYGAGGTLPEQPPLGFQLFNILASNYPSSWGAFPKSVEAVFKENFESGMQLIFEKYSTIVPQLMREMAIYFIQFRPINGASLYCKLISDLSKNKLLSNVIFSTLNYECVLEYSLIQQGHQISYFDGGTEDIIPVWKLHGSCNMFSDGVEAGKGVSYGSGVTWSGGIKATLDTNEVIEHYLVKTGLAPVMCLYMKNKPLNVSPAAVKQLQDMWKQTVEKAAVIVCIGIKPIAEDEHIWVPLSMTTSPLYFIGNKKELETWQTTNRVGETHHIDNRFCSGYTNLIERLKYYGNL